ncbi:hypothetical protein [Agaribacterium sp. ZY112]|uniref:hypothetical protein n=1 Tax=Agaribacterium sp. ZY112 TaxID=3233574 RepID=UPI003523ED17
MSDQRSHDLMHKSYQVLFLIYAPITMISIALKAMGGASVSFLYSVAFFAAVMSLLVMLLIALMILRHKKRLNSELESNLPFVIRHQFMALFLPIAFVSILVSSYRLYDQRAQAVEPLENIVVMVPLTDALDNPSQELRQIKQFLGSFLVDYPEISKNYRIELLNHKHQFDDALFAQVLEKSKAGSKYIVCTFSDVCSKLLAALQALPEDVPKPIVINTLASSTALPMQPNFSYRFYPRSLESVRALAGYGTRSGAMTASFVAADDNFGRNAVEEFGRAWRSLGGTLDEGVYLNPIGDETVLSTRVFERFSEAEKIPDVIFVSLQQPLNNILSELSKRTSLLLGMSYHNEAALVLANGAGEHASNIVMSYPDYQIAQRELHNTTALFLYLTLNKLIETDMRLKASPESDFDALWWEGIKLPYLNIERIENDAAIDVIARPLNESIFAIEPENRASVSIAP